MSEETKKCPYCGEEILKEAKKCKHCGEWLEEKQEKISVAQTIENYINKSVLTSECINIGAALTNEKIKESKMSYNSEEKPLLLLYKKSLFYDLKTRILITDKKIYYKALPDTFWAGITCNFAKKIEGSFELQNITQLSIADHDHCIGTAYVGHQLKINNAVIGLIRIGTGVEYDENAIIYLNSLFEQIVQSNTGQNIAITQIVQENALEDNNSKDIESFSDSGWTIVWKLGLAIIGAIICINLFPNAFDDKIVLTNEFTGEKIEIPVKTTRLEGGEKEYCVTLSIFDGDEHCFCSKDSDSLTKFVTSVKQREIETETSMKMQGQVIPKGMASFFSLDKMIYEPLKQFTGVYERSLEFEQSDSDIEERGDIIDMDEDDYSRSIKESQQQEQSSKPMQQAVQPKQESISQPQNQIQQVPTQTNVVVPKAKPIQTQQQTQDIDDFMN